MSKTYTREELKEIFAKHAAWGRGEKGGLRADLRSADLSSADLRSANLRSANLRSADLSYADLSYAGLSYANLSYAKNITDTLALARFQFLPTEGPFIGWKKVREGILKLCVSKDAKRSHGTERKCRCSQAKCLAIYAPGGTELMEAHSEYDESFTYRKGQIAKCIEPFDEDRWNTCGSGIHFYLTREEAENH